MSSPSSTTQKGQRTLLASFIIICLCAFSLVISRDFFPEPDNVYQHFLGYRLWNPNARLLLDSELNEAGRLSTPSGTHQKTLRLALYRERMADSYTLSNTIAYFFNRALLWKMDPGKSVSYSRFSSQAMYWGVWFQYLLALFLCAWVLFRIRDNRLTFAAVACVSVLFFLDCEPLRQVPTTSFRSFLFPHRDDLVFGFTPRNFFCLLTLGVFALRWSARLGQSYLLLMIGALFHNPYAVLTFITVTVIDLLANRKQLLGKQALAIWLLCAALLAHREPIINTLSYTFLIPIALIIAAAIAYRLRTPAPKQQIGLELRYICRDAMGLLLFTGFACAMLSHLNFYPNPFQPLQEIIPNFSNAAGPLLFDRYRYLIRGATLFSVISVLIIGSKPTPQKALRVCQTALVVILAMTLWARPSIKNRVRHIMAIYDKDYERTAQFQQLNHSEEGRLYYLIMKAADLGVEKVPQL